MKQRLAKLRGERGQAMVEFALVLPILLTVVWGCIEFGRAYWTYQQLSAAVSEGARTAAVSRSVAFPSTTVTTAVRNAAPNLTASNLTVTTTSTPWTPGQSVTVTGTYPESIKILGITLFDQRISSSRTTRIEQ
jgi:Flp pilus assembly protein TadG